MNDRPQDVIALAIRRRIPDFAMPQLMAWDIVIALRDAGLLPQPWMEMDKSDEQTPDVLHDE